MCLLFILQTSFKITLHHSLATKSIKNLIFRFLPAGGRLPPLEASTTNITTTSQRHYVTTPEYWFMTRKANTDDSVAGCRQADKNSSINLRLQWQVCVTTQQREYLPISPQWKGLMPPVVQLYTRAVLGLQSVEDEGHNDVCRRHLVYNSCSSVSVVKLCWYKRLILYSKLLFTSVLTVTVQESAHKMRST